MIFDIVIPVGSIDIEVFKKQLTFTIKNIIGFRNIYIITNKTYFFEVERNDVFFVDEDIFHLFIDYLKREYGEKNKRNGWFFQQLIKFYVSFYIENISDKYLVIDSDVFFLNPTIFFDENSLPMYSYGYEYHIPYFEHMKKLHPMLKKQILVENPKEFSGICHHMIFDKKVLSELFYYVENYQLEKNNIKKPFWRFFLDCVDFDDRRLFRSGCSEYEIYFNYILLFHKEHIRIRKLKFDNFFRDYQNIEKYTNQYDYIAYHYYHRIPF